MFCVTGVEIFMETDRERIAELVRQLQSGNNSVFNELYKLTSSRAYFVALEITKNEQDAEDILQESYIKMLEKINSLDKPESFISWFNHIVANKSKDSLKKKKPALFEGSEDEAFEVIPDEDTSFSPEENLNQDELHNAVMEVIDELTDEKRACVMMMYFEEMSVNEIADTLEIPVSTVKNRLFTARKDLKNKFEKRGITAVYSTAPIGVVIWALTRTSEAIAKAFPGSAASSNVLAGVTAAGSTGAAATATTAAGMTAAAGAGGATSTAAGGIAAKIAALTVAQKVVAGVAVAAVVGGSAVGVATVANNSKTETTTAYTEEITTAPSFSTTQVIEAIVLSTATETETSTATRLVTEKEKTTEKREPEATTAQPTTQSVHTQPSTTKVKKTKATTTRRNYFPNKTTTLKVTTTKENTTVKTTEKTTAEETTDYQEETRRVVTTAATTAAPATVSVEILDSNDDLVDTLTLTVPPDTDMSYDYLYDAIYDAGYDPAGGVYGDCVDAVAQAGGSYSVTAYI